MATVLKFGSEILIGSTNGYWLQDPYSLETCKLKDGEFTCVALNSNFDNFNYFDAYDYRFSFFFAVDDEYQNC